MTTTAPALQPYPSSFSSDPVLPTMAERQYRATHPWKVATALGAVTLLSFFVVSVLIAAAGTAPEASDDPYYFLMGLGMLAGAGMILVGLVGWLVQAMAHPKF